MPTRVVYYTCTRRVSGYPRQPYTRTFNDFLTNLYDFFNFGKFVKIRDFFAEVTNSRSMAVFRSINARRLGGLDNTEAVYPED